MLMLVMKYMTDEVMVNAVVRDTTIVNKILSII